MESHFTPEDEEEQQQLIEMNEQQRRLRERAYFPARNIGVIILEIFTLNWKEELAKGLTSLFEATQPIELDDLRSKGILAAGWSVRVGTIFPGTRPRWPMEQGNVYKDDLPGAVGWIDIEIGQAFDFCFYLIARTYIKGQERDRPLSIKNEFLEAGIYRATRIADGTLYSTVGPDYESRIRNLQSQIEEYLSRFFKGLFLKRTMPKGLRCPNIRVMCADSIDFQHYDVWSGEHVHFLRFLLRSYSLVAASRLDCWLVSQEEDRMFKEASVSSGMNLLCSQANFHAVGDNPIEEQAFQNAAHIFRTWLLPSFVAAYWSHYQLELHLRTWDDRISSLDLQELDRERPSLKSIREIYRKAIEFSNSFERFAISEERNLRTVKTRLRTPAFNSEPARQTPPKIDMFREFVEDRSYLAEEKAGLTNIRRRTNSILSRCRQHSNLRHAEASDTLSFRVMLYTAEVVVLTAILVGLQIYIFTGQKFSALPSVAQYAWLIVAILAVGLAVYIAVHSVRYRP